MGWALPKRAIPDLWLVVDLIKEGFREQGKRIDDLRADMNARFEEQNRRSRHRDNILIAVFTLLFTEIGVGVAIIGLLI